MLTSVVSTMFANFSTDPTIPKLYKDVLGSSIVIMPVIAAFFGQIMTRQRFSEKWKICDVGEFYPRRLHLFYSNIDLITPPPPRSGLCPCFRDLQLQGVD